MKTYFGLIVWLVTICLCAQQKVNYDESKVPAFILPDLLQANSGKRITSATEWETQRRPELLDLFASQMYGCTPEESIDVTYKIITENPNAIGGKATSKQVKFIFSNGKKKVDALLWMYIPNKPTGKVPVFVAYNFKGNHSTTLDSTVLYSPVFHLLKELDHPDWERGNQSSRWSYDKIIDRGYAIATMCYHDIYPDKPEFRDHSIVSLFPGYNPDTIADDEWQAIGAWAWGSSRIVDFLETQEKIDCDKIAIIGHSRQGKAALWAGAQDERFGIVISNDSGCGGAALFRRKFGETATIINNNFPHWFCKNFRQYNNREESLPVDQHQLIALIAPRKVYVASAEEDLWADPRGEFLSAYLAGPVYRLYGLATIDSGEMPEIHKPIMGDIGYHIRAGKHDVTEYDWECYLDFADKHFSNSTNSSGQETFKILSYNALYGLQKDSVNIDRYVSLVNDLQPDIVATQEMNGWTQKTLEELAKRYGHPYALQSKEEGFPVALTSKTPPVNFRKVTENMWHSYIYAKIRGIHIFVIHFSPFSFQKRLEEVTDIIAQANEIPENEPILIMGDFNSVAASDSAYYGNELLTNMRNREKQQAHIRNLNNGHIDYTVLGKLEEAGFKDSYKLFTNEFTASIPTFKDGNGNVKENATGFQRRIDFVWCNATAVKYLTRSIILKNESTNIISDHYPVYVELEMP